MNWIHGDFHFLFVYKLFMTRINFSLFLFIYLSIFFFIPSKLPFAMAMRQFSKYNKKIMLVGLNFFTPREQTNHIGIYLYIFRMIKVNTGSLLK